MPQLPRPIRSARVFGVLVCVLALFANARPAHAFTLSAIRPARDSGNQLWVELRLDQPIEPRVARSLGRGMPATLVLHAELWRRRNGWFDRMERAVDATFRMRYDTWSSTWRLDGPAGSAIVVSSLDSLETVLARTLALPVAHIDRLPQESSYYVVVSAALRPLDVDDAAEVEGWLSGEVREKRGGGLGVVTGLPRSLFDAARNFAGFGDERTRLISDQFVLSRLPALSR